jgi:hypothetical protein
MRPQRPFARNSGRAVYRSSNGLVAPCSTSSRISSSVDGSTQCKSSVAITRGWAFAVEHGLDLDCAFNSIHRTGKLCQHAVPGGDHESAVVLLDQPVNYPAMRREVADRRRFVLPHQAAVAMDVGAEYGGEPALHSRKTIIAVPRTEAVKQSPGRSTACKYPRAFTELRRKGSDRAPLHRR